jgi:hypothetical protein
VILPWFVVIARLGSEGGHEAGQIMAVLAFDMLLHKGQSHLQASGIDL